MQILHSSCIGQSAVSIAAKLLRAVDFMGGEEQLSAPRGIAQSLPGKLMIDDHEPEFPAPWAVEVMVIRHPSLIPLAVTRPGLGGDSAISQ